MSKVLAFIGTETTSQIDGISKRAFINRFQPIASQKFTEFRDKHRINLGFVSLP